MTCENEREEQMNNTILVSNVRANARTTNSKEDKNKCLVNFKEGGDFVLNIKGRCTKLEVVSSNL